MKQVFYIINIITMTTAVIYGWQWVILGSIMSNGSYILIGLLLNIVALICAIQHDKYRKDKDIQNLKEKIIKKLNKLCEDQH